MMNLQSLAVIFIIIVLPISLVLQVYTQSQIDTLNLQISYDSKLKDSTYDAIKAFQLNTINSSTSDLANSKMRDLEASVNAFFTSVATNFNVQGYNASTLQDYVPALVYTLYDGYYIYSPYTNTLKNNESKRYRKPIKNDALLSGILRCSKCGSYMRPKIHTGRIYEETGKVRFSYMCELKEKSRLNKCDCENINGNKLDKILMEKISELIAPNSKICEELKKISLSENIANENDELAQLKEAYNKNQKSLENLIKKIKYVDIELIDDINKEVKLIKQKNLKIKEKIDAITNNALNIGGVTFSEKEIAKIVMEIIQNHLKKFDELDILEQRSFLKLLINKATGSGNDVEIDLLNTDNTSFLRTELLPTSVNSK